MKHEPLPFDDDLPELDDADFAGAKTFAELPAGLQTKLKGGRPKVADAKQVVTLRLRGSLIAQYQAQGANWRALMEQVLTEAVAALAPDGD